MKSKKFSSYETSVLEQLLIQFLIFYLQNPPKYSYDYKISGDNKGVSGHQEVRNGINTTGNYFVKTADSQQDVSYFSDDWGYHPIARYSTKSETSQVSSHFALGKEAVDALHQTEDGKFPLPAQNPTQSDKKSNVRDPSKQNSYSGFLPTSLPTEQPKQNIYEINQNAQPPRNSQINTPSYTNNQDFSSHYQTIQFVQPQQDIIYAETQPSKTGPSQISEALRPQHQPQQQQQQQKYTEFVPSSPLPKQQEFNFERFVSSTTPSQPKVNEDEKSNGLGDQSLNDPDNLFKRPIIVGDFEATTSVNREYLPPLPDHNHGQFHKEVTKVVDAVNQSLDIDQFITDSTPSPKKEAPSRQFLRQFKTRTPAKYQFSDSVSSTTKSSKEQTLVITQRPISNKFLAPVQAGLKLANDDCTDEETHKKHTTKTIIEVQKTVNIKNVLINQPKSQSKSRKCEDDNACSKVFIQQVPVPVPVPFEKKVEVPYPVEKVT